MPILSLQNVSKNYDTDGQTVHALNGVSLAVESGEFVALVGRSGCGKSTLLHLAGAMDFLSEGVVLIDGKASSSLDDTKQTRLRREKVGFIFQSFQLLHTLTYRMSSCRCCSRGNPMHVRKHSSACNGWNWTVLPRPRC